MVFSEHLQISKAQFPNDSEPNRRLSRKVFWTLDSSKNLTRTEKKNGLQCKHLPESASIAFSPLLQVRALFKFVLPPT